MFVTVRYGSDDSQLFNPDCSLVQLVHDMKQRCHCPKGAGVAVMDQKTGDITELKEHSLDNGSELFTQRGVYILLAIYKRESGSSKYVSLLDDIAPELASKLEALSNPKTSDSKTTKGWAKVHTKKPSRMALHQTVTTSKSKRTGSRGGRGKT